MEKKGGGGGKSKLDNLRIDTATLITNVSTYISEFFFIMYFVVFFITYFQVTSVSGLAVELQVKVTALDSRTSPIGSTFIDKIGASMGEKHQFITQN